jgi:two-component system sensor histidine kinase KdpD
MREEREKLRSMLLSSVSHDLKTPLASIIGSLSVYKRMRKSERLSPEIADELTETALDEAQRLDSFISNILDMTRIESGEIEFNKDWVTPYEPLAAIKKRLRQRLRYHKLEITTSETEYEVEMDQMMTEQILQNLIDNAAKYSPANTEIQVSFGPDGKGFSYKIRDQGKGIPDDKFEAIFDKYERLRLTDSQIAGTGLGLAICKASKEKQNARIEVSNHEDGGAVFTIWFPKYRNLIEEKRALNS